MKKVSEITSPAIAGVIREKSVEAAIAEIKNCMYDGADMIDLHMSCLENSGTDALKAIIGSSKLPVLALNYNNKVKGRNCITTRSDTQNFGRRIGKYTERIRRT